MLSQCKETTVPARVCRQCDNAKHTVPSSAAAISFDYNRRGQRPYIPNRLITFPDASCTSRSAPKPVTLASVNRRGEQTDAGRGKLRPGEPARAAWKNSSASHARSEVVLWKYT